MSLEDMRLGAVSEETGGSDGSEPLSVGMSDSLGLCGGNGPGHYSRVHHPALGGSELPAVDSSFFVRVI
jgi:hypothetical protein